MRESKFYRTKVKPILEKWGFIVFRIETGSTATGVPDVWATKPGRQIWVELKSVRACKTVVSPKWEQGQLAFGRRCIHDGQRWALMILVGDEFYWTHEPKEKYEISELRKVGEHGE